MYDKLSQILHIRGADNDLKIAFGKIIVIDVLLCNSFNIMLHTIVVILNGFKWWKTG